MRKMMTERHRDHSLDTIKILATMVIIFHHYQQVYGVFFQDGINFYGGKIYFGYVVELFFIISGYVMLPYVEKIQRGEAFLAFFKKRFLRIFPVMAFTAVWYEIFLYSYYRVYQAELGSYFGIVPSLWGTLIGSLGVQRGWGMADQMVNNPTWYISVLYLCYIILYMIVYWCRRLNISPYYLFVFMVFAGLGVIGHNINLPFFQSETGRGYSAFFFGLLLANWMRNTSWPRKLVMPSALVLVVLTILFARGSSIVQVEMRGILLFVYYPALIILFRSPFTTKVFGRKWIGTLAKISFSTYMWHNPFFLLLLILIKLFHWELDLSSAWSMIGYAVVCFAFGAFFYFAYEKPVGSMLCKKT